MAVIRRHLLCSMLIGIMGAAVPLPSSGAGPGNIGTCNEVGDFSAALLGKAVNKAADDMTSQAGRRALLAIYENARRNHPKFPVGVRNPLFTSRAESASLRNIGVLQTLKHLTLIRDAVIAPTEALVGGDTAGAWAAFGSFAADESVNAGLSLVLGPVPAFAAASALKVYRESVDTLKQETCLLNIDLEFYAVTMSDPEMKKRQGKQRLEYYINGYLVGGGPSPVGTDRAAHRERAQCFLEQHLSPELLSTVVSTGSRNPLWQFVEAVSGSGALINNPAYATAIQTMLIHFDQLQALEASRRDLAALSRDPGYQALKAATEAITPEEGEDLVGRICAAAVEIERGKRGAATPGPAPGSLTAGWAGSWTGTFTNDKGGKGTVRLQLSTSGQTLTGSYQGHVISNVSVSSGGASWEVRPWLHCKGVRHTMTASGSPGSASGTYTVFGCSDGRDYAGTVTWRR